MKSKQKKSDLCKIPSSVTKFVIGLICSIRIKPDLPSPSGFRTNHIQNTIYFPRSIKNAKTQIYHLPNICRSSSLFVDTRSKIFRSIAAKPYKACGNKQTTYAYPNI